MNQDYTVHVVRAAAILTTGYVAGTVIDNSGRSNTLDILAAFTIGSLTDAQIKVEFSTDGTTYYQEAGSTYSAGVSTEALEAHKLAATGNYQFRVAIPNVKWIKISAIGTGTVTSSSLAINAITSTR